MEKWKAVSFTASGHVKWVLSSALSAEFAAAADQYTRDLALCLNNLGSLHFQRRDFSAADAAFVEALEISSRAGF